jgi:hypothetical protein
MMNLDIGPKEISYGRLGGMTFSLFPSLPFCINLNLLPSTILTTHTQTLPTSYSRSFLQPFDQLP